MTDLVKNFVQALLSLDRLSAENMTHDPSHGIPPIRFIEDVVMVALERIGEEWQEGSVSLSQVYMAGRICEEIVNGILPPGHPERKNHPRMAICVLSDHHRLGKAIVFSLMRASGFDLLDYGTIGVNDLVERAKKDNIAVLLVSVLMLPSAPQVRKLRSKLKERGLDIQIVVGGAPFRFDEHLWEEVGADAMCRTASEAVHVIHELIGGAA